MWRMFLLFSFLVEAQILAQTTSVVAIVNDEKITSEELLYAFSKNRNSNQNINEDSLRHFLDQYINFKLKVQEAKTMGLDTSSTFQKEVQSFQEQIPKPYLSGHQLSDEALQEMYEKMQWQINASHILIKLSPAAIPADTLKAFQFLDSLRKRVSGPEAFAQLAKKHSEDGSAQNGGLLGWFTALQMVEPFEDVAYQTPVHSVSQVFRTQYGYHLVYVHQKRKNRGALKTSHLFFDSRKGGADFAREKALAIYDSLQTGTPWDVLASKYSEDEGSKHTGGALQWASLNELPPDYMDIAYSIETIGSYSEPRQTNYGWHIVKLEDIRPPEPFEAMKESLKTAMQQAGRDKLNLQALLDKLKKENGYAWYRENARQVISGLDGLNLSMQETERFKDIILFKHGEKSVKTEAFLAFFPSWKTHFTEDELWNYYTQFETEFILDYENRVAAKKYPAYGFLLQEIEEGLLLFEVMQKKVWDRGTIDSIALRDFYHKNAKRYQFDEAVDCLLISGLSKKEQDTLLTQNIEASNPDALRDWIIQTWGKETGNRLKIAKKTIEETELANFDATNEYLQWFEVHNTQYLCYVLSTVKDVLPDLNQIKGQVMGDFQYKIEQEWLSELKANAKVRIDERVLKGIMQ